MRRLKYNGESDEEIQSIQSRVQAYLKEEILPNFDGFEFFTGQSKDEDGL